MKSIDYRSFKTALNDEDHEAVRELQDNLPPHIRRRLAKSSSASRETLSVVGEGLPEDECREFVYRQTRHGSDKLCRMAVEEGWLPKTGELRQLRALSGLAKAEYATYVDNWLESMTRIIDYIIEKYQPGFHPVIEDFLHSEHSQPAFFVVRRAVENERSSLLAVLGENDALPERTAVGQLLDREDRTKNSDFYRELFNQYEWPKRVLKKRFYADKTSDNFAVIDGLVKSEADETQIDDCFQELYDNLGEYSEKERKKLGRILLNFGC